MSGNYFSFLVCQHQDHVDLYLNGLPIGRIVSDTVAGVEIPSFEVHQFTLADGTKKPLTFQTVVAPAPFPNAAALKSALHEMIDLIDL